MMFQNGYVLAVKDSSGRVLRETGAGTDKTVFMPFDTEYSLLLKNKTINDCLVDVFIDGYSALGEHRLLVHANDELNIERFILDGNLKSGKRFKFVSKDDPGIQDPSSSDLGIISVKFYPVYGKQRVKKSIIKTGQNYKPNSPWNFPNSPWDFPYKSPYVNPTYPSAPNWDDGSMRSTCSNPIVGGLRGISTSNTSNIGGTAEGSTSGQKFETCSVENVSDSYTEISIRILAPEKLTEPLLVSDTKNIFCPECGGKNPIKAKYCMSCGTKIPEIGK